MSRLNVILCDYCKKISKSDAQPAKLKATRGKAGDREEINAELCDSCFDNLKKKFETSINIDSLMEAKAPGPITPIARRGPPSISSCTHSNSKFESPFVICLDCGNQEKI